MEMHMWPRAAAIAERLWSPSTVRDVASMYRRLEIVSTDLELQGLQHRWASTLALQRLAGADAVHPLTALAGAVEPLQYLGRLAPMLQAMMAGKGSGDEFPLSNRLADAVPPESEVARRFNEATHLVRSGREDAAAARASVRTRLTAWRDNDSAVAQMAARSYLLHEVVPLSRDVRGRSLKQASRRSTRSRRARCCLPTGWPLFASALRPISRRPPPAPASSARSCRRSPRTGCASRLSRGSRISWTPQRRPPADERLTRLMWGRALALRAAAPSRPESLPHNDVVCKPDREAPAPNAGARMSRVSPIG
jgi:hypothetical protein